MGREAPSEPVLEVQEGELSCSHIPGWWAAVGKGGGGPSRTPPYSFAVEHWKHLRDAELLERHRGPCVCELADVPADPVPLLFSPRVSLKVVAHASPKK